MDIEDLKYRLTKTIDEWFDEKMQGAVNKKVNLSADAERLVGPNRAAKADPQIADLAPGSVQNTQRKLPEGQRVIRTKSTADRVYLLKEEGKTRQWVTNPQVLESLGFTMADVVEINDEEMLKYQQGQALYRVDS